MNSSSDILVFAGVRSDVRLRNELRKVVVLRCIELRTPKVFDVGSYVDVQRKEEYDGQGSLMGRQS